MLRAVPIYGKEGRNRHSSEEIPRADPKGDIEQTECFCSNDRFRE